jgi:hypothetical protein
MRKIINSAFVSLDGVTADPGSWAIFGWLQATATHIATVASRGVSITADDQARPWW